MCSKQQKPYVELSTNRPVIVHAYGMLTIYRFVIAKPCKRLWQSVPFVIAREQCDRGNLFSPKGYLRILSRSAFRMTDHLVIAVRVSGGHLCEAEAPTEPAGETAARCAAIRFPRPPSLRGSNATAAIRSPPKGYLRILSRYALRMTNHLVIAKPCKRLQQSVPFYRKYGFLNPALKATKTNPL